jgi:hypothetical protein
MKELIEIAEQFNANKHQKRETAAEFSAANFEFFRVPDSETINDDATMQSHTNQIRGRRVVILPFVASSFS